MLHNDWESFCTATIPAPLRVQRWNEYGSQTLSNLTVDPTDARDFSASIARIRFGELGLITMASNGASARSEGLGVGGWASCERDAMMLLVPERGESVFEQNGRTTLLTPGTIAVRDLSRPWVHRCQSSMEMAMVKIPYSLLSERVADIDHFTTSLFHAADPGAAMAISVIRSARHTLALEASAPLQTAIAGLVLDSLNMLTADEVELRQGQQDAGNRSSLKRDAIRLIMKSLNDPELSVAGIAGQLNVSIRTLQRAFLESGESPRHFILNQRLDRAARELRSRQKVSCSILNVALDVGFSDMSHFSRSFSRRHGMSPSQYHRNPPLN